MARKKKEILSMQYGSPSQRRFQMHPLAGNVLETTNEKENENESVVTGVTRIESRTYSFYAGSEFKTAWAIVQFALSNVIV